MELAKPLLANVVAAQLAQHGEKFGKMLQPMVMREVEALMKNWPPPINLIVGSEELSKALKGMSLGAGVLGASQLSDALLQSQKINWNQILPGAFGNHNYTVEAADESDKTSADEDQGQDDALAETEANDESSEE